MVIMMMTRRDGDGIARGCGYSYIDSMTIRRRIAVTILVALASGCPRSPAAPPVPVPKAGTVGTPQEPVPPPVERPIPPDRQGDVPEIPPPVKP